MARLRYASVIGWGLWLVVLRPAAAQDPTAEQPAPQTAPERAVRPVEPLAEQPATAAVEEPQPTAEPELTTDELPGSEPATKPEPEPKSRPQPRAEPRPLPEPPPAAAPAQPEPGPASAAPPQPASTPSATATAFDLADLRTELATAKRQRDSFLEEQRRLTQDTRRLPNQIVTGAMPLDEADARADAIAGKLESYRQTTDAATARATELREQYAAAKGAEKATVENLSKVLDETATLATDLASGASALATAIQEAEREAQLQALYRRDATRLDLTCFAALGTALAGLPSGLSEIAAAPARLLGPLAVLVLVALALWLARAAVPHDDPRGRGRRLAGLDLLLGAVGIGLLQVVATTARYARYDGGLATWPWLWNRAIQIWVGCLAAGFAGYSQLAPRRPDRRPLACPDEVAKHLARALLLGLVTLAVGLPLTRGIARVEGEPGLATLLLETLLGFVWFGLLLHTLGRHGGPLALATSDSDPHRLLRRWRTVLYAALVVIGGVILLLYLGGYRNLSRYLGRAVPLTVAWLTFCLTLLVQAQAALREHAGSLGEIAEEGTAADDLLRHISNSLGFVVPVLGVAILVSGLARIWLVRASMVEPVVAWLHSPLFQSAPKVTPASLLSGLLVLFVTLAIGRFIRFRLQRSQLLESKFDTGVQYATATATYYVVVVVAVVGGVLVAGFELSVLSVFAGTFGIAVGFGSQQIANNLISGFILIFDRTVNVGDYVEIAGTSGVIESITIRCTTVRTADNRVVIVPNTSFLTTQVVGVSARDRRIRVLLPIAVPGDSDAAKVLALLQQTAAQDPEVLGDPAPETWVSTVTAAKLEFQLGVWTAEVERVERLRGRVLAAVWAALEAEGIKPA